uniref:glutathione S-transferase family protein n=1 Tax=Litoreibacter halocynthiae TaxID=1242689 RepID=UPI00249198B8
MLKVYSVDHSLYCAKLRLTLRTKGLEWRDLVPPADYLSLVPTGNLPALVDGDLTLTDSEAIAEYLEEKHPDPAMLPEGLIPRAKSRELSRFHDTRLEPALRLLFSNVTPATRVASEIGAAHAEITKRLTALSTLLNYSPLPRDRLWLCDCGLIVTLEWLELMETHT